MNNRIYFQTDSKASALCDSWLGVTGSIVTTSQLPIGLAFGLRTQMAACEAIKL